MEVFVPKEENRKKTDSRGKVKPCSKKYKPMEEKKRLE